MSGEVTVEDIEVADEIQFGDYVNAVRVLQDGSEEVLIDFAVHSSLAKKAKVLSRIRCKPSFLVTLRNKLDEIVVEKREPQGVMLTTDGGKTAVVFPPAGANDGEA